MNKLKQKEGKKLRNTHTHTATYTHKRHKTSKSETIIYKQKTSKPKQSNMRPKNFSKMM